MKRRQQSNCFDGPKWFRSSTTINCDNGMTETSFHRVSVRNWNKYSNGGPLNCSIHLQKHTAICLLILIACSYQDFVSVDKEKGMLSYYYFCNAFSTVQPISYFKLNSNDNNGKEQDFILKRNSCRELSTKTSFDMKFTTYLSLAAMSDREREIKRKIQALKKEGKIGKRNEQNEFEGMDDDIDNDIEDDIDDDGRILKITDYTEKVRQKLGPSKSKLLGYTSSSSTSETLALDFDKIDSAATNVESTRIASIGALGVSTTSTTSNTVDRKKTPKSKIYSFNESDDYDDDDDDDDDFVRNFEYDDDIDENELNTNDVLEEEEALVDLVARKMQEKMDREQRDKLDRLQQEAREQADQQSLQEELVEKGSLNLTKDTSSVKQQQLTTGVGGSWSKRDNDDDEDDPTNDTYQPKTGSWGAFPRPRDISKAYGGGRRVGPGFSNEAERVKSEDDTREKLKNYRVKMGIEVESEKEHAAEINDALSIAGLAMQRGIYSTAVSALEKVTRYCSTNSKVGGKVFLELAMAYEAVGRTQEAITVYSTLSRSRIEKIKINAKRLLYGIEAMQFMQENVKSKEFSRSKVRTTFIDTTGLADIASKFDDRYETAYVDLSSKSTFYKRLTESVVRSPKEARQVLLMATGPGEVERLRIVQALRSLSRKFDDALQLEIEQNSPVAEPIAVMDGKPILPQTQKTKPTQSVSSTYDEQNYNDGYDDDELDDILAMSDEFILKDANKMIRSLNGEWRLQLLADKRGDGVKFFNTTNAWQVVDTNLMSFTSQGPSAFLSVQQSSGKIVFNNKRRIIRRSMVEKSNVVGAMILSGVDWFTSSRTGPIGAICSPQQVVFVDSVLLMTRHVPSKLKNNLLKRTSSEEDDKDYFAVWRRVESGTYSSPTKKK